MTSATISNDGKKEVENKDLAKKNGNYQELNASHGSDVVVDDNTPKRKGPPKRINEEENVQGAPKMKDLLQSASMKKNRQKTRNQRQKKMCKLPRR